MLLNELFDRISDPVLYHVMANEKAQAVFETNSMPARWMSRIGGRELHGNSMSRNAQFWFGDDYTVRLTFDKFALAARHRIIPVDAEQVLNTTYSPGRFYVGDRHRRDKRETPFQEEFVVGDISQLSSYVIKCEIRLAYVAYMYDVAMLARRWTTEHNIPLVEHPKVTQWVQQREAEWAEDD